MKKLTIILSFLILTSTTFATSVGGSIGGWNIVSQVGSGIGQKLTATKEVMVNGASKVITGTANITPNPTGVAKFMARVGGVALVVDAMDLILDGVDYVMDPVNNTVTYKTKPLDPQNNPSVQYIWTMEGGAPQNYIYASAESAGRAMCAFHKESFQYLWNISTFSAYVRCKKSSGGPDDWNVSSKANPLYDPTHVDESDKPKTVPLSNIGSQVIEQAEKDIRAGNPASPAVALSRAVAEAQAKEAELDDKKAQPIVEQFQKNPEYPSVNEGEGTITTPEITDPITGEVTPPQTSSISMKFPKACEWFPQACEFIDWMKTDPNLDSEMELPEKELEKQEIKDDLVKISSGRCPVDARFILNDLPFGMKINKSYSYQEICNTVEPLKYVFKLITIIFCVLILVRV